MKPGTFLELGKACLNIAVGLFLVGIANPIYRHLERGMDSSKKFLPPSGNSHSRVFCFSVFWCYSP